MRIVWTDEALHDLEEILVYYRREASPHVATTVQRLIIGEITALPPYPERVRESVRVPGTRELVVGKLPYIVFVKVEEGKIIVLNIVHTARNFPA